MNKTNQAKPPKKPRKKESTGRSGETVGKIVQLLKEQILDGRLAPGQRLISTDLVEQFGVSRGPLREAFRQLESADKQNRKTNADVEIAGAQRLIMTGDDGVRYAVSIVTGALTVTPV